MGSGSLEVEQKFRVHSLDVVQQRLNDLGATRVVEESEWDTYLAHPMRSFAETDEALRIRSVGDDAGRHRLTYKGPRGTGEVKIRREIEFPVGESASDRDHVLGFFESLGFSVVADVRKRRVSYSLAHDAADVTVTLDLVAGLPPHIEVEVVSEDEIAAVSAVRSVADSLGLEQAETEQRSYLEMILAAEK